ncbi:hyaluronidase PH-20 [Saccopteryx bilineata]|uniref:hyaluronidase PH-20 n=1 Tax=Saccopteryx bilineata TaxID=59482 RepID=UPI00338DDF38
MLRFKYIFFRSIVGTKEALQVVFTFLLIPFCLTKDFRATPILQGVPFLWGWNVPSDLCFLRFNVSLDLRFFSLKGSPIKSAIGQSITLFYVDRLGLYPHIDSHGTEENGGLPQVASLQKHLEQAEKDIVHYIPTDKEGLAVIDWEEWRPLWERNWRPKDIYRNRSIALVQSQNPQLSTAMATKEAKQQFETAGRMFMEETLKLGKSIRPKHVWGYYLFPDCYNHRYFAQVYNGTCFEIEQKRNNQLNWLWKESTALFPSIYLPSQLKSSPRARLFVRNRVHEAIRVSKVRDVTNPLPIFIYTRPVFTNNPSQFLSEIDLVHTIGETISLGASGMLIWGSLNVSQNVDSCMTMQNYLQRTLNLYLINVTLAAKMCNQLLCKEQGYCTRKTWNSHDYLHLNPMNFKIKFKDGKYTLEGKPSLPDLKELDDKFDCSCYSNTSCQKTFNAKGSHEVHVCFGDSVCINATIKSESNVFHSSTGLMLLLSFLIVLEDECYACTEGLDEYRQPAVPATTAPPAPWDPAARLARRGNFSPELRPSQPLPRRHAGGAGPAHAADSRPRSAGLSSGPAPGRSHRPLLKDWQARLPILHQT